MEQHQLVRDCGNSNFPSHLSVLCSLASSGNSGSELPCAVVASVAAGWSPPSVPVPVHTSMAHYRYAFLDLKAPVVGS